MFLYFPFMHPDLLPAELRAALPDSLQYLDPGLAKPGGPAHHLPPELPFDARTSRALLADTLRFGESLANPRDILAQSIVQEFSQDGSLAPESSRAVQKEVEQSLSGVLGSGPSPEDARAEARKKAQMLLLLAWNLEERLLEMQGIQAGLSTAWKRFDQSVAAGEGDADQGSDKEALALGQELAGFTPPKTDALSLPWRRLLEAFAVLVPGTALCTADPHISAALAEAGVPEGALDDAPGATRVLRAQAWRFMGLDRCPADRPWLEEHLTLGVFADGTGQARA